jgi:hypothetical protein
MTTGKGKGIDAKEVLRRRRVWALSLDHDLDCEGDQIRPKAQADQNSCPNAPAKPDANRDDGHQDRPDWQVANGVDQPEDIAQETFPESDRIDDPRLPWRWRGETRPDCEKREGQQRQGRESS